MRFVPKKLPSNFQEGCGVCVCVLCVVCCVCVVIMVASATRKNREPSGGFWKMGGYKTKVTLRISPVWLIFLIYKTPMGQLSALNQEFSGQLFWAHTTTIWSGYCGNVAGNMSFCRDQVLVQLYRFNWVEQRFVQRTCDPHTHTHPKNWRGSRNRGHWLSVSK